MNNISQIALETATRAWQWLSAFGVEPALWIVFSVGVFIVLRFLRSILAMILRSKKAEETSARNIAARVIDRTWSVFLVALSFAVVAPFLELSSSTGDYARWTLIVLAATQTAIWGQELLTSLFVGYAAKQSKDRSTLSNAKSILTISISVVVWAVALLFILSNFGINVTALVAGLGIGGIAIGLAAQGIFSDLFSSLSIILDKPFSRGDFVMFNNVLGTIENIGLKSTRIRALSGEQVVISNTNLLASTIQNYELLTERRIVFTIGVTYQTPSEKLRQIPVWIKEAIESFEKTRFDRAHFKSFGDSALVFEIVYYVVDPDYVSYMDIQQRINLSLVEKLESESVDFAYPTRTLYVSGSDDAGHMLRKDMSV